MKKAVNFSLHFTILVLLLIKIDRDRVWVKVNYCEICSWENRCGSLCSCCSQPSESQMAMNFSNLLRTRFFVCFDNNDFKIVDELNFFLENHMLNHRQFLRKCFESVFKFTCMTRGRKTAKKLSKLSNGISSTFRRKIFAAQKCVSCWASKNEEKADDVERQKHFALSGNFRRVGRVEWRQMRG